MTNGLPFTVSSSMQKLAKENVAEGGVVKFLHKIIQLLH